MGYLLLTTDGGGIFCGVPFSFTASDKFGNAGLASFFFRCRLGIPRWGKKLHVTKKIKRKHSYWLFGVVTFSPLMNTTNLSLWEPGKRARSGLFPGRMELTQKSWPAVEQKRGPGTYMSVGLETCWHLRGRQIEVSWQKKSKVFYVLNGIQGTKICGKTMQSPENYRESNSVKEGKGEMVEADVL